MDIEELCQKISEEIVDASAGLSMSEYRDMLESVIDTLKTDLQASIECGDD